MLANSGAVNRAGNGIPGFQRRPENFVQLVRDRARSMSEKSSFKEARAPGPAAGFRDMRSTCEGSASYGAGTRASIR